MFKTTVIEAPDSLPVSLETVKEYLRIDGDENDASLNTMISAATALVEGYLRRSLVIRTVALEGKGKTFRLPHSPIIEVLSVEDVDGSPLDYQLVDTEEPPLLILDEEATYVRVEYSCGYEQVPAPMIQEIMSIVLPMFERRGTDYQKEVDAALKRLSSYRLTRAD